MSNSRLQWVWPQVQDKTTPAVTTTAVRTKNGNGKFFSLMHVLHSVGARDRVLSSRATLRPWITLFCGNGGVGPRRTGHVGADNRTGHCGDSSATGLTPHCHRWLGHNLGLTKNVNRSTTVVWIHGFVVRVSCLLHIGSTGSRVGCLRGSYWDCLWGFRLTNSTAHLLLRALG